VAVFFLNGLVSKIKPCNVGVGGFFTFIYTIFKISNFKEIILIENLKKYFRRGISGQKG
jgi:hypothetical protein